MDFLTPFLALLDRLKQLAEEARQNRRTLFAQLIEPLGNDFAPVAQNYILLFERLGKDAAQAETEDEFREAWERFSLQRLEFEQARRRLEVLAETYAKRFGKDDAQEFFAKTCGFFYGDSEAASLSRALQAKLEYKVSRRRQVRRELQNTFKQQPDFEWGSASRPVGPGAFGRQGSFHQERIDRSLRENARDNDRERLNKELSENRADCVREAKELTELLKARWKLLQEMFAELRLKYAL